MKKYLLIGICIGITISVFSTNLVFALTKGIKEETISLSYLAIDQTTTMMKLQQILEDYKEDHIDHHYATILLERELNAIDSWKEQLEGYDNEPLLKELENYKIFWQDLVNQLSVKGHDDFFSYYETNIEKLHKTMENYNNEYSSLFNSRMEIKSLFSSKN